MGINPLDPASTPARPDRDVTRGHGTRALGPSDSSDTGSDVAHPAVNLDTDSDRNETGERASTDPMATEDDGADIGVDHVEDTQLDDDADDEG